jgi:hypothetical protein
VLIAHKNSGRRRIPQNITNAAAQTCFSVSHRIYHVYHVQMAQWEATTSASVLQVHILTPVQQVKIVPFQHQMSFARHVQTIHGQPRVWMCHMAYH